MTKQNEKLLFNEDGSPTARTGKIINSTPMERFGEPEELIGGILYLASEDAASFVTGVVLPIDGRFSCIYRRLINRKQLINGKVALFKPKELNMQPCFNVHIIIPSISE